MIANIAHLLHTPIGELMDMEMGELLEWHQECERIGKRQQEP